MTGFLRNNRVTVGQYLEILGLFDTISILRIGGREIQKKDLNDRISLIFIRNERLIVEFCRVMERILAKVRIFLDLAATPKQLLDALWAF
ncbi:MAG TPA: hypothetical protein VLA21_07480 [Candidatus Limnocylindria bacterium]|nr:hypothetical protein [Candidatus Limnocylindria bacterium]